jgi:hypothetical protein
MHVQGSSVRGLVSTICDAWQASNTDGYFAVTGHWIEEINGMHMLQNALLGFVQMNNSHSGSRLGQAMFTVLDRVGIAHKVSPISV